MVDPIWAVAGAPLLVGAGAGAAPAVASVLVAATVIGVRRRSVRRTAQELRDTQVRRALSVMIAEMSVGAPVVHACRSAADEISRDGPSEVARELARMAARAELGGEPVDGSAGLDRLAAAWAASAGRGLPMIDLMQSLRADLAARAEHASRTRAGLAGPRATATVLAMLPLLGVALGQAMGAEPLAVLLRPGVGGILLVIGTGLAVSGVWWTVAITEKVMG
ncbi:MAG: type II secretion system F family protein [Gordonia sp. (in: high G+C Gram-positive bacteria)]|nr:type II secretion system F family protein [Gordonia sp. (in: high G+C Gram-positive bacteria)]